MDILAGLTRADRKAAHNQVLRAARLSRAARKRFWMMSVEVALGLLLFGGAPMLLIEVRLKKISPEQAALDVHTARFVRTLLDGTFCQYKVYDNRTDYLLEDTVSRCAPERERARPPVKFNWGGDTAPVQPGSPRVKD
jgi:hypothetical protein